MAGASSSRAPARRADRPLHPYTQGLIACLPELDREPDEARPDLPEIPGVVPSIWDRGPGCPFQARCERDAALRRGVSAAGAAVAAGAMHGDADAARLPTRRHPARSMAWPAGFMWRRNHDPQTQTSTPASIHTPAPAASAPLLSVRDLAVHFPYRAAAADRHRSGGGRRVLRAGAGPHAGHRGRVGLEDHHGAVGAAFVRAHRRRPSISTDRT